MTLKLVFVHHYFSIFSPASWLSALIRIKTKCEYNHIEWMDTIHGEEVCTGGVSKGFFSRHFDRWLCEREDKYYTIRELEVSPDVLAKLTKMKGIKYDHMSTIFWHGIHWITGKWYGPTGIAATGKGNCSEIIATALGMPKAYMATTKDILDHIECQLG